MPDVETKRFNPTVELILGIIIAFLGVLVFIAGILVIIF
ncbi:hypothetical protein Desku_0246 [Desulfofundulus kuznetsovii DSM 6115]|uniref:Uncharacterized protein n=2 Tax=Desulfofundulus TaxID=2282741 RepID=A0AAU8PW53_DESK7|nr:hypothetical protein Desku_0246 [Desulfofundulus kuznetsovii DSM 6115]MDQ0287608.1 hypothetical protein [Desulfofundulus luciae]